MVCALGSGSYGQRLTDFYDLLFILTCHFFRSKMTVAAAGLPAPRKDHAECMARFATECRLTMNKVVKQLEVVLG